MIDSKLKTKTYADAILYIAMCIKMGKLENLAGKFNPPDDVKKSL